MRTYVRIARLKTLALAAVSASLALGGPHRLAAQEMVGGPTQAQATRSGFHFAIGVGTASVSASCPSCDTSFFEDRLNGLSGVLQVGAVATPRLVVAGELMGWMKNEDPVYRRVAGLSVALMGYPSESSGFFIKSGIGGIRAIAEDDFLTLQTEAFMSTFGIGLDLQLGERTNLTPYINYVRSFGGQTWINGLVSPVVVTPNAIQLGTSLTVH
jgi:hypothetical protein